MKKVIAIAASVIFACSIFIGCGTTNAASTKNSIGYDDGYEEATHEKFNSPAQENGLGNIKIKVSGVMDRLETEGSARTGILKATDGDWLVFVTDDTYEATATIKLDNWGIESKEVSIYGIYMGYAEKQKMPVVNIMYSPDVGFTGGKLVVKDTAEIFDWTEIYYNPFINSQAQEIYGTSSSAVSISESSKEDMQSAASSKAPSSAVNASGETMGQKNARDKAKEYLAYTAFSYQGLISQLEYEQFSNADSVYAVDNCGADWNVQATKKAKEYLDYGSFSRDGLISQLEYEGFTHAQAVVGADENGY